MLPVTSPFAPPSGLPAISPTRGEIRGGDVGALLINTGAKSDDGIISPLVGEMAGRPEGGAKGRRLRKAKLGVTFPVAPWGHV